MQTECNGLQVSYSLVGSQSAGAPWLVLSHCLAANQELWREQVRELGGKYRILVYDIRGHGSTSAPEGDYSMQELAEDVKALLDKLDTGPVHFAGISLGGMIGQVLALDYPQYVKSLILCDTTCGVPEEMRPTWEERIQAAREHGMQALVEANLDRWLTPEFRRANPETEEWIANMIATTPVSGFAGCCRAISGFDVCDSLHRIDVPTRVIVGEHDPGTPVQAAEAIQQRIPGAELSVLPGARHLTCVEAAEDFNRTVEQFLDSLPG